MARNSSLIEERIQNWNSDLKANLSEAVADVMVH